MLFEKHQTLFGVAYDRRRHLIFPEEFIGAAALANEEDHGVIRTTAQRTTEYPQHLEIVVKINNIGPMVAAVVKEMVEARREPRRLASTRDYRHNQIHANRNDKRGKNPVDDDPSEHRRHPSRHPHARRAYG
ncbi:MAG: hypothetical protein EXS05_10440 [Planctomycetaceae bacterium]|nr:hypothetical protein [Planctomycetaceae bacterium]